MSTNHWGFLEGKVNASHMLLRRSGTGEYLEQRGVGNGALQLLHLLLGPVAGDGEDPGVDDDEDAHGEPEGAQARVQDVACPPHPSWKREGGEEAREELPSWLERLHSPGLRTGRQPRTGGRLMAQEATQLSAIIPHMRPGVRFPVVFPPVTRSHSRGG